LSHHFDMITLKKPEPGAWKLMFTGGSNRAYIVTNMALNHNPQQPSLMVGEDMVLESWLEQDGELLNKEAVLTNTRFLMEVQTPTGETAKFDMFDKGEYGDKKPADGVYSNTLSYENAGIYQIRLLVEGETFQRQKTVHFEIAPTPAGSAKPEQEQPAETEAQIEQEAEPEPTPEPTQDVAAAEQAADPVPAPEEDPEPQVQPEKKKDVSLGLVAGVFMGINLLFAVIGFAVWWLLKKRNKTDEAEAGADEGEKE
ncbi:MAG: choice-of-anchor X domain-containing protein, partial [Thiogranum sp.]